MPIRRLKVKKKGLLRRLSPDKVHQPGSAATENPTPSAGENSSTPPSPDQSPETDFGGATRKREGS